MAWLGKIWNKELAGHPLNWLIVIVVTIMACFLIDAWLTHTGAPKPVTAAREAKKKRHQSATINAAHTASDPYGASSFSSDNIPA